MPVSYERGNPVLLAAIKPSGGGGAYEINPPQDPAVGMCIGASEFPVSAYVGSSDNLKDLKDRGGGVSSDGGTPVLNRVPCVCRAHP